MTGSSEKKEILYVGTYSVRGSAGIYVYEYKNGTLTLLQTIVDLESPTFLGLHPSGKYLYSVNRQPVDGGTDSGSVSAYTIDSKTGRLRFINHVSSYGTGSCHISIDRTGGFAIISNYHGGSLVMLSILKNGSLGSLADLKKYPRPLALQSFGEGVGKAKPQDQARIHSAILSPDNKYVHVADLGSDKIYTYELDTGNGKLNPANQPEVVVAPGSGPRHLTFHPNGRFVYVAEELTSTVASFSFDAASGALTLMQDMIPSLPESFKETNSAADIHLDKTGKFLYQSNRGHNTLAIFSIDTKGHLKLFGHQPTMGKIPRNFGFDPQGKYLLVAHQDSDNITVFRQDAETGLLAFTGTEVKVPAGVCLKFLVLK